MVRFNLVDVGYGVSQALPILVDTLQRPAADEVFLLQQPEVHLHPRAQAELGSFFVSQAGKKRRFVIETHSDYLVDRVRMEIRRGNIRAQDVSLLSFRTEKARRDDSQRRVGKGRRYSQPAGRLPPVLLG